RLCGQYPSRHGEPCSVLTKVSIPDKVISIGNYAFELCTDLTTITIPKGVSSIGEGVFVGCHSLTEILVSAENSAYCSADGILFTADKTELICFPQGKGNITDSYEIPGGVTSVADWAFNSSYSDTGLTNITIPDSVISVNGKAFAYCSGLTEILVSAENPAYCSVDGVLFTAGKMELVCCPCGKGSMSDYYEILGGVTSIGDYAFYACEWWGVVIPSSVTSIGDDAFWNCTRLTGVYYGGSEEDWTAIKIGKNNDPLTNATIHYNVMFGSASGACGRYVVWTLDSGVLTISGTGEMNNYYSEETRPYYDYRNDITSVVITDGVTSIGYNAFYSCENLTSVTISDNVTSIGGRAFYGCSSLTNVYYGGSEDDWNAIEIDYSNNPLTSATIHYNSTGPDSTGDTDNTGSSGGGDSSKVVDALDVLEYEIDENGNVTITGCDTSANGRLEIPNTIEDCPVTTISDGAFQNCTLLTDVVIPDSVTYVWHGAFQNCTSLANITLPQTPAWIGSEAFENTAYYNDSANWSGGALYLDNYLLRVETDATGTYTIADGTICIGYGALMDCSGVTGVSIPDTVKLIGVEAFARTGITSAVIPEGVEKMDEVAFGGCALTSLYLPRSLTWIGADMCESLEAIYYAGTEAEWAAVYIDDFWNTAFMSAPVYFLGEESGVSVPGDLNGDGEVNASDLPDLARHVGKVKYNNEEADIATEDETGDGNESASDLTKLAQYVGKIISSLD
ncbi:MAG: leucine-rich repeat protein, partial [Oscillospiraceae bacterium]|nr:leucine-rich repeat protein [Oscillospiraceae bacterium]